jgi:GTPase SAR1 family protein
MSIRIVENEKPALPHCKMLCDSKLAEKLDNYELTSFLNNHSTTLFIGKPKSGKTSLLYSFFKSKKLMNKVFDKIFLFQPSASRASMSDKLFDKIPDDQKYEELNLENLMDAESKLSPENNVMIFDDMTAYLKDKQNLKKLKELVFNRRHLHLSIFFLVQTFYSVPKDIRKMFSNIFIFKVSKNELSAIWDEVIEYSTDLIVPILRAVYDEPYQFLFINTDSQRLFKCWDEILIEE